MLKKNLFTLLFSVLLLTAIAQNEVVLSSQGNFEIAYKALKLDEGGKDKWLITVTATNKNEYPVYYSLPTYKASDGSISLNPFGTLFSDKVTVRNATGFLASDGVKIKGETTSIFTQGKNGVLIQYDPGRIYNYENTINVKHGDTPIITVSHNYPLKKLSEFNTETSAALVDGDYKTSCGANPFSLAVRQSEGKTYLLQSVNGKQIKWVKTSSTMFVKESDTNSTLSYNKDRNVFNYSSSDGINCEWSKL